MSGRAALRFMTAGESHGPMLTAILDGMPSGLPIDRSALDSELARRQAGFGASGRQRIESDRATITAGVLKGVTTGAPIALLVQNNDHVNWAGRDIQPMTVPRPGHADLSAAVKYGYGDLRLSLERASARETAVRVAVGALCKQLLGELGVTVGSHVVRIGSVAWEPAAEERRAELLDRAEGSEVRCADPAASDTMIEEIRAAAREGDTVGGVFEVLCLGVPPGLGSHVQWDRRLTGRLVGAVASIPAVKGAEIGPAFDNASRRGTEVHGGFTQDRGSIVRTSSRAGGLEGGITTGGPLIVRAAMKPIATTLAPGQSIDLASGESAETTYERSDVCAVPRAAVVAEAMVAFVLADSLLQKLGGDSMTELRERHSKLRAAALDDLPMDDASWQWSDGADEARGP